MFDPRMHQTDFTPFQTLKKTKKNLKEKMNMPKRFSVRFLIPTWIHWIPSTPRLVHHLEDLTEGALAQDLVRGCQKQGNFQNGLHGLKTGEPQKQGNPKMANACRIGKWKHPRGGTRTQKKPSDAGVGFQMKGLPARCLETWRRKFKTCGPIPIGFILTPTHLQQPEGLRPHGPAGGVAGVRETQEAGPPRGAAGDGVGGAQSGPKDPLANAE